MKILVISPTQKGIGGVARHVQGLTNFLKNDGHEVDVISSENTFTIPIRKLKNPSFMLFSFLKTKFSKKYDVIHAQSMISAFAMKNVSGKKLLAIHGIHHEQVDHLHGKTAGNIAKDYENHAINWIDAITVSSKEMLDYYSKKGAKTFFLPNALDLKSIPKTSDRKFYKQIVYAARLSKEKGILEVLEMAKKLPEDVHLLILGSGIEENKVKALSKRQKNIHFLGYQTKEDTLAIIRGSDLLIQPSRMEGGLSYTLLESMACGTPIICTDVGGAKDTLSHMKDAFIITPQNSEELLSAILFLMNDSKKREELKKNALEEIKNHDWSVIGPKYVEIYEKLLNENKGKCY